MNWDGEGLVLLTAVTITEVSPSYGKRKKWSPFKPEEQHFFKKKITGHLCSVLISSHRGELQVEHMNTNNTSLSIGSAVLCWHVLGKTDMGHKAKLIDRLLPVERIFFLVGFLCISDDSQACWWPMVYYSAIKIFCQQSYAWCLMNYHNRRRISSKQNQK